MTKNTLAYFILFAIIVFVSLGFTSTKKITINHNIPLNYLVAESAEATVLTVVEAQAKESFNQQFFFPYLAKGFVGFKEALAFKESSGNYFVVNDFGYMGKYQFGKGTLAMVGVYNTEHFLNTPALQEKAFMANLSRNKWVLRKDIKRYVGKRMNGMLITESGILATAHLAGPGNVKKYLRSWGKVRFSDGYGTSIAYYMRKFSGYDTSIITPNRKAKVL